MVLPDDRRRHCSRIAVAILLLPACGQFGSFDLRTLDRHPGAPISSLAPLVSCRRCSPNSPFAKLELLAAERGPLVPAFAASYIPPVAFDFVSHAMQNGPPSP
jgi:hypothetical protein